MPTAAARRCPATASGRLARCSVCALSDGPLQLTIQTEGGIKQLTRLDRDGNRQMFRAAMGLPTRPPSDAASTAAGETLDAVVLNIGNPQLHRARAAARR